MHADPAARLSRAILGYLALMILIVTLAPFRFEATRVHGFVPVTNARDVVLNIVLFLPVGFTYQLGLGRGAPAAWVRASVLGGALSLGIEAAQLFAPGRFPAITDVATNTLGAALGALLAAHLRATTDGRMAVRAMALDLPLIGLTYLLVPILLLSGLSFSQGESSLLMLPAATAAWIIASVHAEHRAGEADAPDTTRPFPTMTAAIVLGIGLLPAVPAAPEAGPACAIVFAAFVRLRRAAPAWLTQERIAAGSPVRRFEAATLRVAVAPLIAFVVLHALWPLDAAAAPWRGTLALLPPGIDADERAIFKVMAYVSAFTAIGYAVAEHSGRALAQPRQLVVRATAWGAALALPLELLRGARAGSITSGPILVLCVGAAGFGAWLFVLTLRNIRALLGRGPAA